MNQRVMGFALICVALVVGLLGIAMSTGSHGRTPALWLQTGVVFPIEKAVDCSAFGMAQSEPVCAGSDRSYTIGRTTIPSSSTRYKTVFAIPAGIFSAGVLAVALLGLGFLALSKRHT